MAAYLPKPQPSRETPDVWIMTRYLATIRWCLGHRRATIAVATAFLVVSGALVPFIPPGFIPASDVGYTTVTFELPPGSSFQRPLGRSEERRVGKGCDITCRERWERQHSKKQLECKK